MAWQDFGNFQDMEGKEREKTERLRFGRFFYRFPNGESGAGAHNHTAAHANTVHMPSRLLPAVHGRQALLYILLAGC
jgi:hypothetical protein